MDVLNEISKRAKEIGVEVMKGLEQGEVPKLQGAVRHYPEGGGKRLRPVLAIAVAQAIAGDSGKRMAMPFAVCLELVHNFTLVHDDVMDNDPVRRGRKAVHVLYDVPTAIIAGDALFARAFDILATADVPSKHLKRLLSITANTVWLIAEGQQEDMDFERTPAEQLSVEDYMRMIRKKTAVLFECAAEGGALIADASEEQVAALRDYAYLLGMGFQIHDDILDLTSTEEVLGKPIGTDIRNGKRTLMVLHALSTLPEGDKRRNDLLKALGNESATKEEVDAAMSALHDSGSVEHARHMAADFAARARKDLDVLRDGEEKEFLTALVDYAVGERAT